MSDTPTPPRAPVFAEALQRTGRFAGGLIEDIRRRKPYYLHDFRAGLHTKVFASTLFLFFAALANAIAFGGLTGVVTGGEIGTVEMLVITAIGGVSFALFSGQPLTILGGTGPIVIFTGLMYETCRQLDLPFLPMYAWSGIWAGGIMVLLALTDASFLMRYFTRFTDEIFAALISVIFIVEAVSDVAATFARTTPDTREIGLLSLVLAMGTFSLASAFRRFRMSSYLSKMLRDFTADFGPAIAIAVMAGFAVLLSDVHQQSPDVPAHFGTTTGRTWLVDLAALPVWARWAAAIPAILASILLFLDQNITTRLVNARQHRLMKGPGYHLDLLVVGLLIGIGSLFGLPWIVAATVHSLNHVQSLATTRQVRVGNQTITQIVGVRENRVSGFAIHALIGVSLLFLHAVEWIPLSVLFGLFLYMGFSSLAGNQFSERVLLWVTDPKLYPDTHYVRRVPARTMHIFTLVQLLALAALWVLKTSRFGIAFPVLIALLVPLRMAMKRHFSPAHIAALDSEEEDEGVADRML